MLMPITCYLCMGMNNIISWFHHLNHANDLRFLESLKSNFEKIYLWNQEYFQHMYKVWFENPSSSPVGIDGIRGKYRDKEHEIFSVHYRS